MASVDLFGNVIPDLITPINKKAASWYRQIIALYGYSPGNKCANCKHFKRMSRAASWSKCLIADPNAASGPSGDWRARYDACGKFERPYTFKIGDVVCRKNDPWHSGEVVEVITLSRFKIKWITPAGNGQQHSTINHDSLMLVK